MEINTFLYTYVLIIIFNYTNSRQYTFNDELDWDYVNRKYFNVNF